MASSHQTNITFMSLSEDVLEHICVFLSPRDIACLGCVCRPLRAIAHRRHTLNLVLSKTMTKSAITTASQGNVEAAIQVLVKMTSNQLMDSIDFLRFLCSLDQACTILREPTTKRELELQPICASTTDQHFETVECTVKPTNMYWSSRGQGPDTIDYLVYMLPPLSFVTHLEISTFRYMTVTFAWPRMQFLFFSHIPTASAKPIAVTPIINSRVTTRPQVVALQFPVPARFVVVALHGKSFRQYQYTQHYVCVRHVRVFGFTDPAFAISPKSASSLFKITTSATDTAMLSPSAINALNILKRAGNAAFREEQFDSAIVSFTTALDMLHGTDRSAATTQGVAEASRDIAMFHRTHENPTIIPRKPFQSNVSPALNSVVTAALNRKLTFASSFFSKRAKCFLHVDRFTDAMSDCALALICEDNKPQSSSETDLLNYDEEDDDDKQTQPSCSLRRLQRASRLLSHYLSQATNKPPHLADRSEEICSDFGDEAATMVRRWTEAGGDCVCGATMAVDEN